MDDMNWIQRKIYLYNVTFGLYMLEWWERFTFNTLVIVSMSFVVRFVIEVFKRYRQFISFLLGHLFNYWHKWHSVIS